MGRSILFVISIIAALVFFDYASMWLLSNVIYNVFNWYNHQSIFLCSVLFVFLGMPLFIFLAKIVGLLASALTAVINVNFKSTPLSVQITQGIVLVNIILTVVYLWKSFPSFGFLTFLEFISLTYIMVTLNYVFLIRKST